MNPVLILMLLGATLGLGLGWTATRFRPDPDLITDWIDALLPQTQCGRCSYPGCKPYAEAIAADQADINRCPPGGREGILALASLLGREPKPLNPTHAALVPPRIVIDEQRCIGCTLCIQACPVDAIVGASKLMHTVIESECTGCELCLPPCPVDCIDIIDTVPVTGVATTPGAGVACINCGACIETCPASLWPQQLHRLIRDGQLSEAQDYGLTECIECGDCDVVCPSRIPLLEWFHKGKAELHLWEQENQATRLAGKRFTDRKTRLARLETERNEKMQQRKQVLKDKATRQERIRASLARAQCSKHVPGNSDNRQ